MRTANRAEAVVVPPKSVSRVEILGVSVPRESFCVHLDAPPPVWEIVIEPPAFDILIPVPAVSVASENPSVALFPISICPSVILVPVIFSPVPPFAKGRIPVTSDAPPARLRAEEESTPDAFDLTIPVESPETTIFRSVLLRE